MRWLVAALLLLAGCGKDGEPVTTTFSADEYNVERLFEVDGCSVYRFRTFGNSHYFTNCHGNTSTSRTESCGKNCTTTVLEEIPTR